MCACGLMSKTNTKDSKKRNRNKLMKTESSSVIYSSRNLKENKRHMNIFPAITAFCTLISKRWQCFYFILFYYFSFQKNLVITFLVQRMFIKNGTFEVN